MRKYYLSCKIICDICGDKDYFDDGKSLYEYQLESHIDKYYKKIDGKDVCEKCLRRHIAKKK